MQQHNILSCSQLGCDYSNCISRSWQTLGSSIYFVVGQPIHTTDTECLTLYSVQKQNSENKLFSSKPQNKYNFIKKLMVNAV